jgi:hypothetical protein
MGDTVHDPGTGDRADEELRRQAGPLTTGGYKGNPLRATRAGDKERKVAVRDDLKAPQDDLLRLVVEEIDQARDVYELAQQLAPYLPIKSFDMLVRAVGKRPLRFRDTEFDLESLHGQLPGVAFPVEDLAGLVEKLGHLIRLVPPSLGVDMSTPSGVRRQMKSSAQLAPGLGVPATRGLIAIARSAGPGGQGSPSPGPAIETQSG